MNTRLDLDPNDADALLFMAEEKERFCSFLAKAQQQKREMWLIEGSKWYGATLCTDLKFTLGALLMSALFVGCTVYQIWG